MSQFKLVPIQFKLLLIASWSIMAWVGLIFHNNQCQFIQTNPVFASRMQATPPYLRPISVSLELLWIKKPPPDRSQVQLPASPTGSYRTSGPTGSHTWRLVARSLHSWRHSCKARSWSRALSRNYSGRSINLDTASTSGKEHFPVAPLTADSSKDSGHHQRIFSHPPTRSTQGSFESTLMISKFSTHPNQQHAKRAVTRGGRGADLEALAAIAEIQQMNKTRLHEEKKAQEEEERPEKAAGQTGTEMEMEDGDAQGTVTTSSGEIHKIMGRTKASEDDDDTRSPLPKRSGSSKSSSRRNANKVSPPKAAGAVAPAKSTKFLNSYVHPFQSYFGPCNYPQEGEGFPGVHNHPGGPRN